MIEFYDRLATCFDVMTDWQSRLAFELSFLRATLERYQARSVLDVACGTGGHVIALAQRGYRVAGSDASSVMIARANEKAMQAGLTIPFAVATFEQLRSTWQEPFDAVLCLGNSLPHVLSDDAAMGSLANMHACLRDGGLLVLHNLNYDKRLRDRPRWFGVDSGVLHGAETLIWRFCDYETDRINFHIAIFTRAEDGKWSVSVESTPQRPFRAAELQDLLHRVGFRTLELYGNLRGEPFDPARSGDLVIVASK